MWPLNLITRSRTSHSQQNRTNRQHTVTVHKSNVRPKCVQCQWSAVLRANVGWIVSGSYSFDCDQSSRDAVLNPQILDVDLFSSWRQSSSCRDSSSSPWISVQVQFWLTKVGFSDQWTNIYQFCTTWCQCVSFRFSWWQCYSCLSPWAVLYSWSTDSRDATSCWLPCCLASGPVRVRIAVNVYCAFGIFKYYLQRSYLKR